MNATIKSETILKLADWEVIHHAGVDTDCDYAYQVFDQDDDLVFETDDRDEAIQQAREGQEELDAERKAERVSDLQNDLIERLADCDDEETLKKILAYVRKQGC